MNKSDIIMNIGEALEEAKMGKRVRSVNWPKGFFIDAVRIPFTFIDTNDIQGYKFRRFHYDCDTNTITYIEKIVSSDRCFSVDDVLSLWEFFTDDVNIAVN